MAKRIRWRKYLFELLSVFLGVTLAFALNNWNEVKRERNTEKKTLLEIKNGLGMDIADLNENTWGHKMGIDACKRFVKYVNNESTSMDTLVFSAYFLMRDFVSIQNSSGYEALKSIGLETITNDTLRLKIIGLYDFDHEILKSLEENYEEIQFHRSFFHPINDMLAPYMIFNNSGMQVSFKTPIKLSNTDKNRFLSYLWKIRGNRTFLLQQYEETKAKTEQLISDIEKEIARLN